MATHQRDQQQQDRADLDLDSGGGAGGSSLGLQALMTLGMPTPAQVAALLASFPGDQAMVLAFCQQMFGNQFAVEVMAVASGQGQAEAVEPAPAAATQHAVDPEGPLGESSGVDPAQVAHDQITGGATDENQVTNEVFWQCYPALRGIKLKAGTPAADEWLHLRDTAVRPAFKHHGPAHQEHAQHAPAHHAPTPAVEPEAHHEVAQQSTLENKDDAGADHIRSQARQQTEHVQQAPVHSDDAGLQALLDWTPVGQSGPQGEAAWLLAAVDTGLVGAFPETRDQLAQMSQGDQWIHSVEKEPGKKHQQHVDGVKRVSSGHYDVDVGDAPILDVLVTLARSRIRDWVGSGSKKRHQLFSLGTLVRGDVGFGGSQHTKGNAIDIGGMSFNDDKDVLALLDGLEPGKISKVFPDNNNHVHLSLDSKGRYELGFPFQGNFFSTRNELGHANKAAQNAAGSPSPGTTIHAEGLQKYSIWYYESTGTYAGDGKWTWSKPSISGKARSHLQSGKLKALLDHLENGGDDGDAVGAAQEDGQEPGHEHAH